MPELPPPSIVDPASWDCVGFHITPRGDSAQSRPGVAFNNIHLEEEEAFSQQNTLVTSSRPSEFESEAVSSNSSTPTGNRFDSLITSYQPPIEEREIIYSTKPTLYSYKGYNNHLQLHDAQAEHVDDTNHAETLWEQQRKEIIALFNDIKSKQEEHHKKMRRDMYDLQIQLDNFEELCEARNNNFFAENRKPIQYPSFVASSGHPKLPRLKQDLLHLSNNDCRVILKLLRLPEGPRDETLDLKQQRIAEYLGCFIW